jgi:hypothetical protein
MDTDLLEKLVIPPLNNTFSPFMERDNSLTCSQEITSCAHIEPEYPVHSHVFPEDTF